MSSGTAQTNKEESAVRLYAGPTTAEATARTKGYRFSRITAFYILIYTDKEPPKSFIEITEDEAHRLTTADRQWLNDCQTALVLEHVQREKPKIVDKLNELLNIVESITNNERAKEGKANGAEQPPDTGTVDTGSAL